MLGFKLTISDTVQDVQGKSLQLKTMCVVLVSPITLRSQVITGTIRVNFFEMTERAIGDFVGNFHCKQVLCAARSNSLVIVHKACVFIMAECRTKINDLAVKISLKHHINEELFFS